MSIEYLSKADGGEVNAACLLASWNDYVNRFVSLGYLQLRVEEMP